MSASVSFQRLPVLHGDEEYRITVESKNSWMGVDMSEAAVLALANHMIKAVHDRKAIQGMNGHLNGNA